MNSFKEDTPEFHAMFRMDVDSFNWLLSRVGNELAKEYTFMQWRIQIVLQGANYGERGSASLYGGVGACPQWGPGAKPLIFADQGVRRTKSP